VNIVDLLDQIWTQILQVTAIFVTPDWSFLIGLLPVLILLGVIGPFVTGLAIGTLVYQARKPRVNVKLVEGPRVAEIGPGGEPVFPVGLPYCRRDALVYPSGAIRCERCHDELAVICPMCRLGRAAVIDTCTNCGLVLKVKPRAVVVRSTGGPKPGGAAVA
jgi:hypothetical protein